MNAQVGAWEPPASLGVEHAEALDRAAEQAASGVLAPSEDDAVRLREITGAAEAARASLFDGLDAARLVGWLRALTLAGETVPGCEAGASSPVIDIARALRARGEYPAELTAWIKSVSSNRFLPYGSLMDRLR